ncbi:MAG: hypothetical protein ACE5I5_11665 [Candidatus Heimdallarchaeota archaeon]
MRMKTQKALKNGRVAKALLVCSFTVFLLLGTGMASATDPPTCVVCGCECPGTHEGNAPPFCDGYHPSLRLYKEEIRPGWHGLCRAMCKQGIFAP